MTTPNTASPHASPQNSTSAVDLQTSSEKLFTDPTSTHVPQDPHLVPDPSSTHQNNNTNKTSLHHRVIESTSSFFPLALVAFGGPPAHIALFYDTFVTRKKWLSDGLFSELFAVTQALPGPGSTEMLFSIAIHRGGLVAAIAAFIVWSLPGLIVMTALALGVSKLPTPLPPWLIQITNGVSAAAVGLVAQAGVSLARKIVKAHPQMIVCTLAACAAVLWRASWLEPVVIVGGGVVFGVVVWVTRAWNRWQTDRDLKNRKKKDEAVEADVEEGITDKDEEPDQGQQQKVDKQVQELEQGHVPMSWKMGIVVIAVIVILLVVCMVLKPQLMENRAWAVITQFYVAGCVIFGGGPVVIPLLYGYVVDPGFVSPRDFLLGVALIQAMPGPNFNFASYCGALVLAPYGPAASIGGALLGYTGIFFPGLALNAAVVPLWSYIRKSKRLLAVLPGINAAAVGLVFSAAFAVWEKGIVRGDVVRPLGDFPFYAVVAGVAFVLVDWGVRTPVAMLFGAVMGVIGWGVGV